MHQTPTCLIPRAEGKSQTGSLTCIQGPTSPSGPLPTELQAQKATERHTDILVVERVSTCRRLRLAGESLPLPRSGATSAWDAKEEAFFLDLGFEFVVACVLEVLGFALHTHG